MSRIKAYAQLLRIPNVFTAMADVLLGWSVAMYAVHSAASDWTIVDWLGTFQRQRPVIVNLLLISSCLYCAGMVLNDFFDVEEDQRERPFRPIPSGRIARSRAGLLGVILLGTAMLVAWITPPRFIFCGNCSWEIEPTWTWRPFYVAAPLAGCVLLYDGWLKRTWAGPLGMGACRFLNALLGMAALGQPPERWMWTLAAIVGVYIAGVTWFARKEAARSRGSLLTAAAGVMLAAVATAWLLPLWWQSTHEPAVVYLILLGLWTIVVARPVVQAIRDPQPMRVQAAVKMCILGLIGLDAVLAFAFVGWPGLLILLLLPPALLLGRWVYST